MFGRPLVFAVLAMSSAAAAAADPKQPTGKWVAEFAEHECILSRAYGTPKDVLILAFQKLPMQAGIELNVLKTGKRTDSAHGRARVGFLRGTSVDVAFGAYRVGPNIRKISVGLADESYRSVAESGVVSLSIPRELEEGFTVPGFGAALNILDRCVVNLGEAWGISKDQQTRVGRPAKLIEPESLFDSNDYPDGALKEDASGRTIVRYVVDEAGRSSDCVVLKTSGNKFLDLATCSKLLKRARFEPALDVQGRPMRSISVTAVNWLIVIS
jgi:TonB family protein